MTEYVGIDFGNAMVKAAVVETPDGSPKTLRLSERDPFLPLALREGTTGYRAGWSAYAHRRRDTLHTVVSMRDRWNSPTLTASLAGRPQQVTALLGEYLAATGARIQRAANEPVGVVITVPDSWDHANWALPVAARAAGWTPEAYVREWVAALTIAGPPAGSTAMLLSLGYSGARATLCRISKGGWKPLVTVNESAVSGRELRKRLIARVAESMIQQARRDPREDPESDQDLYDAVEAALYQLHRQPTTAVELTLSGKTYSVPYSRETLLGLVDDFPSALRRLIAGVRENAAAANCPLIVWGELTGLLPVAEWLSGQGTVQVQSLDSLAAGAARLCAAVVTGSLKSKSTGAVCPHCGEHAALKKPAECPQCREPLLPVWESLPTEGGGDESEPEPPPQPTAAPVPERVKTAVLTMRGAGGQSKKTITTDHFRLGRNPQSDWAFADHEFPGVSSAHAVISRHGDSYRLRDLGSTNGTFLNDRPLDGEHELKPGDEFRLGHNGPRIVFELRVEG